LHFLSITKHLKEAIFNIFGPKVVGRGGQQHTTSLGCKPLNILGQIHRLNLCKIENLIQSKEY
jgi:hypothetical protein